MREIKAEDTYEDFNKKLKKFKKMILVIVQLSQHFNKLAVGKMKDETAGDPIKEFVRLRSKIYSFLVNIIKQKI